MNADPCKREFIVVPDAFSGRRVSRVACNSFPPPPPGPFHLPTPGDATAGACRVFAYIQATIGGGGEWFVIGVQTIGLTFGSQRSAVTTGLLETVTNFILPVRA